MSCRAASRAAGSSDSGVTADVLSGASASLIEVYSGLQQLPLLSERIVEI